MIHNYMFLLLILETRVSILLLYPARVITESQSSWSTACKSGTLSESWDAKVKTVRTKELTVIYTLHPDGSQLWANWTATLTPTHIRACWQADSSSRDTAVNFKLIVKICFFTDFFTKVKAGQPVVTLTEYWNISRWIAASRSGALLIIIDDRCINKPPEYVGSILFTTSQTRWIHKRHESASTASLTWWRSETSSKT